LGLLSGAAICISFPGTGPVANANLERRGSENTSLRILSEWRGRPTVILTLMLLL
jgi:hypothetical protein